MIDFLLSVLGAAAGAGAATLLAFKRYRRERSLDRVVEWHERVLLALQRMQRHLETVAFWQASEADDAAAKKAKDALIDFLPEFTEVTGQRVLYGASEGQIYVADAERTAELVAAAWQRSRTESPDYDLVRAGEIMWRAAHQIGIELRRELGLKDHLWEGSYENERQLRKPE